MEKLVQLSDELNAFTVQFHDSLLDEIRSSYKQELHAILTNPENQHIFEGGTRKGGSVGQNNTEYFLLSYGTYPLFWLSGNTEKTYQIYRRFFDALEIEDEIKLLVDHQEKIVMYCGFLVIGNRAPSSLWHVDYRPGANAYTLITPLFEPAPDHGNLLYKDNDELDRIYPYELGKAIIFGEQFIHSTEPYNLSKEIRVLVSMTFGTDKIEYWDILEKTIGNQSSYFILPCGHVAGTCHCRTSALK